jgi:hypothetical protein
MLQAMKHYFFLGTGRQCSASGQDIHGGFSGRRIGNDRKDTCGIRTHTGRPHRLSGPTPSPLRQSVPAAPIITSVLGQSGPLAGRPGMPAFTWGGEASALGSTSAVLGCARIGPRLQRGACVRLRSYNWQAGALNAKTEATPRGFEPLRAEPDGFRVHPLSRMDSMSCDATLCNVQIHFCDTFHDHAPTRSGVSENTPG